MEEREGADGSWVWERGRSEEVRVVKIRLTRMTF